MFAMEALPSQHSLQKELFMKVRAAFYSFPMASRAWGFRVKSWAHSNQTIWPQRSQSTAHNPSHPSCEVTAFCYLKASSGHKHAKHLGNQVRHYAISYLRKSSKDPKTTKICFMTHYKTTTSKTMKKALM